MLRIAAEAPQAAIDLEQLDLADLRNVADFAARYARQNDRLDLLILNAGVMLPPESRTAQGFELQFGVNHLGHFALTGHLLPLIRATRGARIVAVSSGAATRGSLDFDDLQFTTRDYAPWEAYAQSKLANQLFVRELQRRLDAVGSSVLVTAAHPGWTATGLQRHSRLLRLFSRYFAMQPTCGALPTLRAALDPAATGADYYGPGGFLQLRAPQAHRDVVQARRDDDAARLWEISGRPDRCVLRSAAGPHDPHGPALDPAGSGLGGHGFLAPTRTGYRPGRR